MTTEEGYRQDNRGRDGETDEGLGIRIRNLGIGFLLLIVAAVVGIGALIGF